MPTTAAENADEIQVVAAAIQSPDGRFLLSRRAAHQHQGGLWEFPGGKLEAGEAQTEALARELDEELGIRPLNARPLISLSHRYAERRIRLHAWRVSAYQGEAYPREGQPLRWMPLEALAADLFPAANRAIVNALQLPDAYLITAGTCSPEALVDSIRSALGAGIRLVQLRLPEASLDQMRVQALRLRPLCHQAGARLVINGDPRGLGPELADGIHLNSQLLASLEPGDLQAWRPRWIGASCHNRDEIRRAEALGCNYLSLSPVRPTASHPLAEPLGWERFASLCREAHCPVYALGGMTPAHLPRAWDAGAQGVAGIGAFQCPKARSSA